MKIDIDRLKEKATKFRSKKDHSEISNTPVGTEDNTEESVSFSKLATKSNEESKEAEDQKAFQGITINDSEFFDQTLFDTTIPMNQVKLESKTKLNAYLAESEENEKNIEKAVPLTETQGTDIFELSQDSMMKQPEGMLSSFMTTWNQKQSSTYKSGVSAELTDSMGYSLTKLSLYKDPSRKTMLEVIKSESGDTGSQASPDACKNKNKDDIFDEEEDFDRFEEIDIKAVSIGSSQISNKKGNQKALLSPEEIEEAHKARENDLNNEKMAKAQYVLQCKNLIESGKFTVEDFKSGNSALYEWLEILENTSKEYFNKYVEEKILQFHPNYDFGLGEMVNKDIWKWSLELVEHFEEQKPTKEEIYYYAKYIVLSSRMESEIPLIALIYIERLMTKLGIFLNHWNWRRIVLITLIVASKIWDDESLENKHFPKAMPDLSIKEVNSLEKIFLDLTSYELIIKGSDYARYYFILRALAEKEENPDLMQIDPITYLDMLKLQKNSDRAEIVLKEIHKYNDLSATNNYYNQSL